MVSETAIIVASAIATALFFDFVNGFHDSANSIATVVGTKVLKPLQAVSIAAVANVAGPFIFGTAVARTVGENVIQPEFSSVLVITAGLVGAIVWDLITWYFGLPTSSSHALIGGLIGSALVAGGIGALVWPGIETTLIFMVVSPLVGMVVSFAFCTAIMFFFMRKRLETINNIFGKLQIVSSAFFSLTHGANDGQKTMGIITALLIAGGFLHEAEFEVPFWVVISAASAIGFGTFLGGWRIVKTMAFRLTPLKPYQGFAAESGGGAILAVMASFGIPVSTTHSISGAIIGAGASRRFSAVRWTMAGQVVAAWIITIPASAAVAALVLYIIISITGTYKL